MRTKGIKLISIIFIMIASVLVGCSFYKSENDGGKRQADISVNNEIKSDVDLSFVVMGDIHNNTSNFQDAVDDFKNINSNIDALVLNGDTVDQGTDEQYDSMKKVIDKNSTKLPKVIIKNLGNHEFYNYDESSNSKEDIENFTKKYLDFSGTEKVYHDMWIKGYHFISLGSDNLVSEDLSSTQASISKEQLLWLKEKLSENYEKGKPIFVFLHQPMTIDFFGRQWSGVRQEDELKEILKDYPEVFIFSSHTHKEFGEDSILENKPYTMVHTGEVGYTLVKSEDSENGRERESSYNSDIYIEVKENEVTINERDVKNNNWVYSKKITHESE